MQQEAERDREGALAHARAARLASLRAIVGGRIPKADLVDHLAWSIIENADRWKAQELACQIAIEPSGEGEEEEADPALVAAAEAGPEQALRVALPLTLGTSEARIADRWRAVWERVTRHFAILEAHGYTVCDVERKELEQARSRRAG